MQCTHPRLVSVVIIHLRTTVCFDTSHKRKHRAQISLDHNILTKGRLFRRWALKPKSRRALLLRVPNLMRA